MTGTEGWPVFWPVFGNETENRKNLSAVSGPLGVACRRAAKHPPRREQANQLKGLILAQNERWRRGLGMQVEREVYFGKWTAAKGTVMCRYLPLDLG